MRGQRQARRGFARVLARGRVAHAYLICGPQGTGKRRLADAVARALLCASGGVGDLQPQEVGGCGECASCRIFSGGNHSGLELLEAAGSRNIEIDGVRGLLGDLSLRGSGRRVVIIDPAEKLGEAAANALLKTLEEPGVGVVFMLISHRPAHLLPTIISRCQRVSCASLAQEEFAEVLAEHRIEPAQAATLHHASGGSPGVALRLAEAIDGCGGGEVFEEVLKAPPSDPRALGELSPSVTGEAARDRILRVARLLEAGVWAHRGETVRQRWYAAQRSTYLGEICATLEKGQSPELALELMARVLAAKDAADLAAALPAAVGR